VLPLAKVALETKALGNAKRRDNTALDLLAALSGALATDRSIRCLPYPYEGCGPRYADYEHQTSTLRLPKYRFTRIAGELRSLGANTTCGGDTVTNPSCGSGGSCDDSRAP
jgi:hypothetical protein